MVVACRGGGCIRPFLFVETVRKKGDGAFMKDVFAALLQAAVETLAALAADPLFVIAVAQTALQLLRRKVKHIKK